MRLVLITFIALCAFAANSVLARAAMATGAIDPASFTAFRMGAGAITLSILMLGINKNPARAGSWTAAAALLVYAGAFSFAYLSLDAGIGALILFAAVQFTMFGGGLLAGERPRAGRWAGMALGLLGLAILFVPGAHAPNAAGAGLMVVSGIAWGQYSLRGRHVDDALAATAGNFLRATPGAVIIWMLAGSGHVEASGAALAIASGALASGVGYAIWYSVLPKLDASMAAIAQLGVPIIALGGGMIWLRESATLAFVVASICILGGVGLAVLAKRR